MIFADSRGYLHSAAGDTVRRDYSPTVYQTVWRGYLLTLEIFSEICIDGRKLDFIFEQMTVCRKQMMVRDETSLSYFSETYAAGKESEFGKRKVGSQINTSVMYI